MSTISNATGKITKVLLSLFLLQYLYLLPYAHAASVVAFKTCSVISSGAYVIDGKNRDAFSANIIYDLTNKSATGTLKLNAIASQGNRIAMQSTLLSDVVLTSDKMVTLQGQCTVNGVSGYSFSASLTDVANPGVNKDKFSITITGSNLNFSLTNKVISGGDISITYTPLPPTPLKIFGVSDVHWGPLEYTKVSNMYWPLPQNVLVDEYRNGIEIFFNGNTELGLSDTGGQAQISFRLASKSTPNQILKIEIYSVIFDTMQENTLVRTLVKNQSVTLDPDPAINGYSKYFKNYISWDGLDDNGVKVPSAYYKVKVSTAEANNWDEEVVFSDNYKIIPRRFLRSPILKTQFGIVEDSAFQQAAPNGATIIAQLIQSGILVRVNTNAVQLKHNTDEYIVRPALLAGSNFDAVWDQLQQSQYRMIGSDLEKGINSGLYPIYRTMPPTPYSSALPPPFLPPECQTLISPTGNYTECCRPSTDNINDIKSAFYSLGLTVPEANALVDDLHANGYIGYSVFNNAADATWVDWARYYSSLPSTPEELQLSPQFINYRTDIYNILKLSFSFWSGSCLRAGFGGLPLLEGPLQHGIQSDSLFYFGGVRAAYCGWSNPNPECAALGWYGSCMGFMCMNFSPWEYPRPYWGQGEIPVQVDYYGYLYAPIAGTYKFHLDADDSGKLTLGGNLTVQGYVSGITHTGGTVLGTADASNNHIFDAELNLQPGYYPLEINFNNTIGNSRLNLYWNIRDANNQNFIFTDPTFIQQNKDNNNAFEEFMGNAQEASK